MDFTSRMVALMADMRRERNGAVADDMRYYGAKYGLNYGVSLPTLRKSVPQKDYDFAKYLYQQDVREMKLAALHLAFHEPFALSELDFWMHGIVNSELAEEGAFALFSRLEEFGTFFLPWLESDLPLINYTALMAAARHAGAQTSWCAAAWSGLAKRVGAYAGAERIGMLSASEALHLWEQGTIALLSAVAQRGTAEKNFVAELIAGHGGVKSLERVYDELSWRLEY